MKLAVSIALLCLCACADSCRDDRAWLTLYGYEYGHVSGTDGAR